MLEKYQLIQNLFLWAMLIFGTLGLISLAGWRFYGLKVNSIKEKINSEIREKDKSDIIEKIEETKPNLNLESNENNEKNDMSEKSVKKIIKGDEVKGDKIGGDKIVGKKEEINAPNALIVTKDQKGGNNTVINQKVETPLPQIKLNKWVIQNQVVTEIQDELLRQKVNLPNEEIQDTSLIRNQFHVNYISEIARNAIGFRIKRKDVVVGQISKSGRLMWKIAGTPEGWFVYVIQQPENGIYKIDLYTRDKIKDIMAEFDYLK